MSAELALAITAPGGPEIALIVFLALLLFGGRKLPELGSSVGKTITNFRKGLNEAKEEDEQEAAEQPPVTTTSTTAGPPATAATVDEPGDKA